MKFKRIIACILTALALMSVCGCNAKGPVAEDKETSAPAITPQAYIKKHIIGVWEPNDEVGHYFAFYNDGSAEYMAKDGSGYKKYNYRVTGNYIAMIDINRGNEVFGLRDVHMENEDTFTYTSHISRNTLTMKRMKDY